MPRCSECQKFVSIDDGEPTPEANLEVEGHVDGEAIINGDVRIANACSECQTELAEYIFSFEHIVAVNHDGYSEECALTVEADLQRDMNYEGRGRGTKTYYGYTGPVTVTCDTHEKEVGGRECSDFVQASMMDSLL